MNFPIGSVVSPVKSCTSGQCFSSRMYCLGLDGFHGLFCNNDGIFDGVSLLGSHDVFSVGVLFQSTDSRSHRVPCVMSLRVLITPWSRGWLTDIVWGQETTSTPLVLHSWGSGWPGTLSQIKRTLKGSLLARYFWLQGQRINGTNLEKGLSLSKPCCTKDWQLVFTFSLQDSGVSSFTHKGSSS